MHHRNIRFRLYPKSPQKANLLCQCLGATRFVWNHFLAKNKKMMQAHRNDDSCPRPNTTFFSVGKEFIELRQQIDWMQKLPCAPIRYTLKYQADAWRECFKGSRGFPKFKSYDDVDSVTFPTGSFKLTGDGVHLAKIGQVVLSGDNPYTGCQAKSVVIKRQLDKFYATVCFEVPDEQVAKLENGVAIGIDMNVGQFATSDGEICSMPDTRDYEAKKRRYARQMSRRERGNHKKGIKPSNRYLKSRHRYNKACRKVKTIRSNWHHHQSRRIADHNQYAVVEALHTKAMTRSAKGDVDNPGKNVKAKSGLNRVILNTGWSGLKQKLAYKAELVEVNPKHTSQRCNVCGHIDKDNRKTQSKFVCVSCGHSDNADINAALNILALGTRAIGHGGRSGYRPVELSRKYAA